MSDMKRQFRSRSHRAAIVLTIASLLVALWLLLNRQFIIDQVSVWQYHPNQEIVALVERSSMSDTGEFYFYASHPSLESRETFNDKCARKEHSTAILGCYNGRNIYIFDVPNEQLDGIREVTAAHEMLHAVYARLSEGERRRVDELLEAEYNKLKVDPKLAERIAFYARTEPGERNNELHSLIGTEVTSISPELETHFERYFIDRSRTIVLHAKYEKVFSDLQDRGKSLSDQLTSLADEIEADTFTYNKAVNQLDGEITAFNTKATNGGFATQEEFQADRTILLERADQLEAMRATITSKVAQYEALRQELTVVAGQSETLNRSIDSSLAPAPSL